MSSKTFFHLLGKISVTFASIEHRLVSLLEHLLVENDTTLIRPYMLDELSLSRCIQKLFPVAELRLWDHKAVYIELKEILKAINNLRIQRNLFIHGDWFTEDIDDYTSSVTVIDYRPELDRTSGVWNYLKSVRVTREKLQDVLQKSSSALESLTLVDKKIRGLELR